MTSYIIIFQIVITLCCIKRYLLIEQLKKKVKKRKIGAVCRFVYDRQMPADFLQYLVDSFELNPDELIPGDKHLNLQDLSKLPNPNPALVRSALPSPMMLGCPSA